MFGYVALSDRILICGECIDLFEVRIWLSCRERADRWRLTNFHWRQG